MLTKKIIKLGGPRGKRKNCANKNKDKVVAPISDIDLEEEIERLLIGYNPKIQKIFDQEGQTKLAVTGMHYLERHYRLDTRHGLIEKTKDSLAVIVECRGIF